MNLQQLIAASREGRSFTHLQRDAGGTPTSQGWHAIASGRASRRMPDADTLVGIARALRVNTRTVVLAAAETAGIEVHDDRSLLVRMLPPDVDLLDPEDVATLLGMVALFLKRRRDLAVADPAAAGRSVPAVESAPRAVLASVPVG